MCPIFGLFPQVLKMLVHVLYPSEIKFHNEPQLIFTIRIKLKGLFRKFLPLTLTF